MSISCSLFFEFRNLQIEKPANSNKRIPMAMEIYKSTTDDDAILERESWWKELLMTRQFGYNKN